MKNIILLFLVAFLCQTVVGQVWIVGDNFVYSKGTNIFVKDAITLDSDSKVFLREEAQLIQENDVDNAGDGVISVFQEGTTNSFSYNYWSSPVSDESTGTDGNVGFKNSQMKYPVISAAAAMGASATTDFTIDFEDATILAQNVRNGISDDAQIGGSPLQIAGRWLYTYDSGGDPTTGYAGWSRFNNSTAVARSGYGFTMKGVTDTGGLNYNSFNGATGQRYDFRGRPNNGTIEVGVGNDNGTLAGNPYPSALDLKRFIDQNSNPSGTVKMDPWVDFWVSQVETDHNLVSYLGGYARYIPMGYAAATPAHDFNGYETDGEYLAPIFRRTDNDGNILTASAQQSDGTMIGGPPGDSFSYGANLSDGRRRYAAIGQGFFISRTNTTVPGDMNSFREMATPSITAGTTLTGGVTGEMIEFNNSMRVFQREDNSGVAPSVFGRAGGAGNSGPQSGAAARQLPKMIINVVPDGLYARPLKFVFHPSTSQGYDYSWEGPISGRVATDAYIKIGTDGEFGLSSQAFDEDMVIPLGVEVAGSNSAPIDMEFEVAFLINFDPADIFLHDTQTGTYHDIKSGNQTLMIAPGHYTDRFEITFKNTSGTLSNESLVATNFDVFQNNGKRVLTVLNPNLQDVANISLYDLAGRVVFSEKPASTESSYTFETATLSSAIYIARITTKENKELAVKVSISN